MVVFTPTLGFQDTLLECVSKKVPMLLSRGLARLLVIDSVAAPFRCDFDGPNLAPRAQRLQALGATLRRLSTAFWSPVLCVNQVGMHTFGETMGRQRQQWGPHI